MTDSLDSGLVHRSVNGSSHEEKPRRIDDVNGENEANDTKDEIENNGQAGLSKERGGNRDRESLHSKEIVLPSDSRDARGDGPKTYGPGEGISSRQEWKFMYCLFVTMFMAGWNDATTGPLLLTMQAHYDVSYTVISITFICTFIGFFVAAFVNVWLTDLLGFGKLITLAAGLQCIGYAIQAPAPPFPLYLISFFVNGLSMGLQDAQANLLCSRLSDITTKMSLLHAIYGAGGTISPLVATQFAGKAYWHYYYLLSLGIAIVNACYLGVCFRGKREEVALNVAASTFDEEDAEDSKDLDVSTNETPTRDSTIDLEIIPMPPQKQKRSSSSKMGKILREPMVWLILAYAFIYVGVEVTVGGWTTAFLQVVRGAGNSAGYVSSGFFGGLTLGRVAHVLMSKMMDENYLVLIFLTLSVGLELVVWLVPHIVGDAVAVCFVGFLLGPLYPILINVTTNVLPRWMMAGALGLIASGGQGGSAAWPFATGALSSKYGSPWVLQPLIVALTGLLVVLWIGVLWGGRKHLRRPLLSWKGKVATA